MTETDPTALFADLDETPPTATPQFAEPMAAKLWDEPFSGEEWVFERKLDGVRCLLVRDGDETALWSRNRKRMDGGYPELLDALRAQPLQQFVLDAEIVAFQGDQTSFSRLQGRMQIRDPEKARATGIAVYAYCFDAINLARHDISALPLRTRKALLKQAVNFEDPLRFTPHRNTDGETFYEQACADGWEGLIAKRADGPYRHTRSSDWRKLKCNHRQELVIGGWTDPQGERSHFGALLVGYHQDGRLRYAGRVGTGYSQDVLADLGQRLDDLHRDDCPFDDHDDSAKGVHWVEPALVGEVEFTEWTDDGRLRHPAFLGLRHDKDPGAVVREDRR